MIQAAGADPSEQVLAMLVDDSVPAITKAAQLKMLPESAQRSSERWLAAALTHAEPLVRLSALDVANAANAEVEAEMSTGCCEIRCSLFALPRCKFGRKGI